MTLLRFLLFALGLVAFSNGEAGSPPTVGEMEKLSREVSAALPDAVKPSGRVHHVDLLAAEFESGILPPFRARLFAYNRQIPGPVIRIQLGDTLEVRLLNDLPQATTIHWHGVRVPNRMDGVPGLTQKRVEPGASFTYRFTPKDAGTFWFHPHLAAAEQVEKGLHGVLVVEDPNDPPYSQDWVWILDDWLIDQDGGLYDEYVTRHDLAHDGRWGNFMTINGQFRPDFRVKPGERLRIRLVNVANGRVFAPNFYGLNATVIAVDGMPVAESFELSNFLLAPGNRVDLDLTITKQSAGSRIRIEDRFSGRTTQIGTLAVDSEGFVESPEFEAPRAASFADFSSAFGLPIRHEFLLDAEGGGPYGIAWTIDGRVWPRFEAVELEAGKLVRLRFTNLSGRLHPMHLHGQFFQLLARGGEAANERFWRDTVLVGPEESVDIGLIPRDSGIWANHCHILEHAEAGMMTAVRVK